MVYCCSICQERLEVKDNPEEKICASKCGHIFHFSCIKEWWMRQYQKGYSMQGGLLGPVQCPVCRFPNMPHLFEIKLAFRDDSLDEPENEINEMIILEENMAEIEVECREIEKGIAEINRELGDGKKTTDMLKAVIIAATKERDNYKNMKQKKSRKEAINISAKGRQADENRGRGRKNEVKSLEVKVKFESQAKLTKRQRGLGDYNHTQNQVNRQNRYNLRN